MTETQAQSVEAMQCLVSQHANNVSDNDRKFLARTLDTITNLDEISDAVYIQIGMATDGVVSEVADTLKRFGILATPQQFRDSYDLQLTLGVSQ